MRGGSVDADAGAAGTHRADRDPGDEGNTLLHAGNIAARRLLAALHGKLAQLFLAGQLPPAALIAGSAHLIPSRSMRYLMARNVMPKSFAAAVRLKRVFSSASLMAARSTRSR